MAKIEGRIVDKAKGQSLEARVQVLSSPALHRAIVPDVQDIIAAVQAVMMWA